MTQGTVVTDLDLPYFNSDGLERDEAMALAEELAKESWIVRTDVGFAVLRQADVSALLRDKRFFNAISLIPQMQQAEDPTGYFSQRSPSIITTEGDAHTRLRRLVSPAFTPAAADRHRPAMRSVVTDLVAPWRGEGHIELVAEVCEPYPIPIICEVLGAPKEDWQLFSAWATGIFKIFNSNVNEDLPDIIAASTALADYVSDMVEERRSTPGEDLLSDLIAAEEAGDRLTTDELARLAEAVLMAGTDTTRNQLGCVMALFAQHPEQWARLRADRSLVPKAIEEAMRYLGAVRATVRYASCDIVYRDLLFPEGTIVTTMLAAANRDPAVFDHPDDFDIEATRGIEQMTFGSGVHRCLGAALARAELQEALSVLLDEFATVSLDGPVEWKPPGFGIWGPARLPLAFTRPD